MKLNNSLVWWVVLNQWLQIWCIWVFIDGIVNLYIKSISWHSILVHFKYKEQTELIKSLKTKNFSME